ncbi:MAG: SGNH/GDSL hydrolase family protein [Candidatus Eiseniibacteriota bacterium]
MRRRLMPLIVAALVIGMPVGAGAEPPTCQVPDDLTYTDAPLPRVAAAIKAKAPLKIMVVGTASSEGLGLSPPAKPYPAELERALKAMFPDSPIKMVVRAKRGETASTQSTFMVRSVVPEKPVLVIWQTGTVDAVRAVDPGDFGDALIAGIDLMRYKGTDVILMDMQYSTPTASVVNYPPYIDYMRRIAASRQVMLFDRYEIMQYWSTSGITSFVSTSKAKQQEDAEFVHRCIGRLLAQMIKAAVAAPR